MRSRCAASAAPRKRLASLTGLLTDLAQSAAVDASVLSEVYQRLQSLGNVCSRHTSRAFQA